MFDFVLIVNNQKISEYHIGNAGQIEQFVLDFIVKGVLTKPSDKVNLLHVKKIDAKFMSLILKHNQHA